MPARHRTCALTLLRRPVHGIHDRARARRLRRFKCGNPWRHTARRHVSACACACGVGFRHLDSPPARAVSLSALSVAVTLARSLARSLSRTRPFSLVLSVSPSLFLARARALSNSRSLSLSLSLSRTLARSLLPPRCPASPAHSPHLRGTAAARHTHASCASKGSTPAADAVLRGAKEKLRKKQG